MSANNVVDGVGGKGDKKNLKILYHNGMTYEKMFISA